MLEAQDQTNPITSAGRAGLREGEISELTIIAPLKEGGADRLREKLKKAHQDKPKRWRRSRPFTTCAS